MWVQQEEVVGGEMICFPGDERKAWVWGRWIGCQLKIDISMIWPLWTEVMWPRQCCHIKSQFSCISITPPICLFVWKHQPNSSSADLSLTSSCLLTFYLAFTCLWGFQTEDWGDKQRMLARSHWITALTNDTVIVSQQLTVSSWHCVGVGSRAATDSEQIIAVLSKVIILTCEYVNRDCFSDSFSGEQEVMKIQLYLWRRPPSVWV